MRLHISPVNTLLVLIAFGWFLLFAHKGLAAPFSGDDLMNLHGYLCHSPVSLIVDNLCYWSTSYRPLGGLFYVLFYSWFGFDPLPFRVACFGLLALNLGLLWRFTLRLSGSREVAFLTLLLAGYHAWFVDLYYSTGTIFDLLCYSFYLAAFNLYLNARAQRPNLSWRQLGTVSALYVCALNAKEMAVSLPVLLAAYEAVYHAPALRQGVHRWLHAEGRGVLVTGLLTLPYVAGKLLGAGSLVENPAYRLTISPGRYLDTFHLYLNPLLYQDHVFRDPNTVQLLSGMLALALWRRSRPLLFAWCFLLASLLPVAFIAHYAAFFLYLPMAGWALYAAVLLVMVRRLLASLLVRVVRVGGTRAERLRMISVAVLPLLLVSCLAPCHRRESMKTLRTFISVQPPSRQLAGEMTALQPGLPHGGRVLFLRDPFARDDYFLLFLTRLLYRDMSIIVERAPLGQGPLIQHGHYDAVFGFQHGHLVRATWTQ
ncbi:hypothetical protein [Paludibaculum fermentans]|uniref:Glycosyltransferase RgtA/B/C/D-like domain-containing protein n=1 Tax=Paludibaculum fermentans TaxID=1473598 RepID=A0A7S7NVP8_PALFE|nr:hypothetical protein [Paludibaculum fermentans]QOY90661.1 hypothetical protein IRI77_12140 [Paludibaculum fermentans]